MVMIDTAALTRRLGAELVRDRKLILGIGPLAAVTRHVAILRDHGAQRPLVLARGLGTGPVPSPEDAEIRMLQLPSATTMVEDLRLETAYLQRPPEPIAREVEAYDPERQAVWWLAPWVGLAEVGGRPVMAPRRPEWVALEDKTVVDEVFDASDVRRPSSIVAAPTYEALSSAAARLDTGSGTVWAGDAREGINGGAELVRWVRTDADARAAVAVLGASCDRVRVAPFVEGVPCSVHGIVMPDGVAVLRPVELLMLRGSDGRFVYCGAASWWDPPAADREVMRSAARRLGAELARRVGFLGGFSMDGILGAEGWVPTEVNTRFSGGLSMLARSLPEFPLTLLQAALIESVDTGVTAAEVETALLGAADARRTASALAFTRTAPAVPELQAPVEGGVVVYGESSFGGLVRFAPEPDAVQQGDRFAPLVALALAVADEQWDTGFGVCTPAPDVRSGAESSTVELEPVTAANWRDCAALTVRPEQARYVAAVTFYLCLCTYGSVWKPLAITRGGAVVGFCMWGVDDDASRWIGGLVVDVSAQRSGVARAAVTMLVERFEAEADCPNVALSYSPDNVAAGKLYASLGFRETEETLDDGNEVVARRQVPTDR